MPSCSHCLSCQLKSSEHLYQLQSEAGCDKPTAFQCLLPPCSYGSWFWLLVSLKLPLLRSSVTPRSPILMDDDQSYFRLFWGIWHHSPSNWFALSDIFQSVSQISEAYLTKQRRFRPHRAFVREGTQTNKHQVQYVLGVQWKHKGP